MSNPTGHNTAVVMGAGLTGLSAGCVLSDAGYRVKVFEQDNEVGGLSKTVEKNGFRFDLGGHRFFTRNRKIDDFVKTLMQEELITVQRTSKIYMRGKYFDYPLKPMNAMFGMGIPTTLKIMTDFAAEKATGMLRKKESVSLEDWVVSNFGRTMFNIYFREYSEKVWGIDCSRISAEWVAQRIKGLSLATAVKSAFFKFSGKDIATLADSFVYPQFGIGRISDRLKEEIERNNSNVFTRTGVERIRHSNFRIDSISVRNDMDFRDVYGNEFVSSLPLNKLINMLDPAPPEEIRAAAARLKFRDLVIVAIMVDRKKVTDQTWIYVPEKKIPFGRIHEPTNWSDKMAPEGKTIMVMEFFSFRGDEIWDRSDEGLTDITVQHLQDLGFIRSKEVIGSVVVRAAKAYPLFEVGYRENCSEILNYLEQFRNLHMAGRVGMFRYYNMDHAIESGISAAENIIKKGVETMREQDDFREPILAAG